MPDDPAWPLAFTLTAAVVIAGHGLVHLMGTALLWKLGEPGQLRYAAAVPTPGTIPGYLAGGLWLAAALVFVIAALLLLARRGAWRAAALAGLVVSVPAIGLTPGSSAAGLVTNGLILVLVAATWLHARARSR